MWAVRLVGHIHFARHGHIGPGAGRDRCETQSQNDERRQEKDQQSPDRKEHHGNVTMLPKPAESKAVRSLAAESRQRLVSGHENQRKNRYFTRAANTSTSRMSRSRPP